MKANSGEYILGLRTAQLEIFQCPARFRVVPAGRRFGKTELALVEMFVAAHHLRNAKVWYIAPSYRMAKQIAWSRLKDLTRPYWAGRPSESQLTITLTSGGTITLLGADRPDSLRGSGLDFVVLDEFASMHASVWTHAVRPALADRMGRALFIGTPSGHNHFYDLYQYAITSGDPEWAGFLRSSEEGGNVTRAELESAARQLDKDTFEQEFGGRFVGSTRTHVYHNFSCGFSRNRSRILL